MSDESERLEANYAVRRVPGRFYVSSRFQPEISEHIRGPASRFAYQVFDAAEDVVFESDKGWELAVRETSTRQQLKALFFEDTRQIPRLAFQRFDASGAPIRREYFVLSGEEVEQLAAFLTLVRSASLDLATDPSGARLLPHGVDALLSDNLTRTEVFERYRETFTELIEADVNSPEVIAYARRRKELSKFEHLLTDEDFFHSERQRVGSSHHLGSVEKVWQEFFENNKWIFGSGLAVQFLHAWNPTKLEQTAVGSSIFGPGKRPDAIMHTAGALSALVLVEIKRHDTELLRPTSYRSGAWRISDELAGAVCQCQATVDLTIRYAENEIMKTDDDGYETGERVVLCRPRSILVVGSLKEFCRDDRANIAMFECFERFRRSINDPEIVTFDELSDRAEMVLSMRSTEEHFEENTENGWQPPLPEPPPEDVPF